MRIAVLVGNPLVQRPGYTTTCLSYEAWRRGHHVGWISADGLSLGADGHVRGHVQALAPPSNGVELSREGYLQALLAAEPTWWELASCELVLVRLLARPRPLDEDDGRYETYYRARIEAVLAFATRLAQTCPEVRVINDPQGLWRTHGKMLLAELPERMRPRMLVTRNHDELREFVANQPGTTVLKPLMGHGGEDVFLVHAQDPNLNQILGVIGRAGYIVAQEFVPLDSAFGERRLIMLGGKPLRDPQTGKLASYRRDPKPGDWRGNIHQGATTTQAAHDLGPNVLEIAAHLGPLLEQWGLDLVGLDFRGDKLLEVNAFCPGGVDLVHRQAGFDPAPLILDSWEGA